MAKEMHAGGGTKKKETLGQYIKRIGNQKKKLENTMSWSDVDHLFKRIQLNNVRNNGKKTYQDAKNNGAQETHYNMKDMPAEAFDYRDDRRKKR